MMIGYMEVIMDDSYLHTSLNTRKLHLLFDNYNLVINSNVWKSKVKLDDQTELSNHYSELMSSWMDGYESVIHQCGEGTKYSFEVDLDEHLSYIDEYKAKHRL